LTSCSTLLDSFKWKQHLWQLHGPEQINPREHAYEQASKFAPLLSGSRLVSVSISVGRLFTFFHNQQVGFFFLKFGCRLGYQYQKHLCPDLVINIFW
jgi:hypothetical protein